MSSKEQGGEGGEAAEAASRWSNCSTSYNLGSGQPISMPLIQSGFDHQFFPLLDAELAKRGGGGDPTKEPSSPLRILSLCGGTGAETLTLCQRYSADQVRILTTDISEGMLKVCQDTLDKRGLGDRVETRIMDATDVQAPDESYDVVTLIMGPMLLPDPEACFRHVHRVLKPGGLLCTMTPGKMGVHDVMTETRRRLLEDLGREKDYKSVYDQDMFRLWGKPELLSSRIESTGLFVTVEARCDQATILLPTVEVLEESLASLRDNPGTKQAYCKDLSQDQVSRFHEEVRSEFFRQRDSCQDKAKFGIEAQTNCAWAFKASK
ncbi:S-adenosyl-L-methionine-dependent methyltransferase [Violaceomyces palustris]|uniref:S-adenosyl-L-methionine-dependent methyltransferase n=1 Tax=Violaceomyces palustris TaxID=1673888 RepID=A0ACD0NU17_9BASI|nr:S-adenosyl-L-methionine-dependent methyltransferase [Violaceomyces palustris]